MANSNVASSGGGVVDRVKGKLELSESGGAGVVGSIVSEAKNLGVVNNVILGEIGQKSRHI